MPENGARFIFELVDRSSASTTGAPSAVPVVVPPTPSAPSAPADPGRAERERVTDSRRQRAVDRGVEQGLFEPLPTPTAPIPLTTEAGVSAIPLVPVDVAPDAGRPVLPLSTRGGPAVNVGTDDVEGLLQMQRESAAVSEAERAGLELDPDASLSEKGAKALDFLRTTESLRKETQARDKEITDRQRAEEQSQRESRLEGTAREQQVFNTGLDLSSGGLQALGLVRTAGALRALGGLGRASPALAAGTAAVTLPVATAIGAAAVATTAVDSVAGEIRDISPQLILAQTRNEVLDMIQSFQTNAMLGNEVAAITGTRGDISRDLREIRNVVLEPALQIMQDLLVSVQKGTESVAEFVTNNGPLIQDATKLLLKFLMAGKVGLITELFDMAKRRDEREQKVHDKEMTPLFFVQGIEHLEVPGIVPTDRGVFSSRDGTNQIGAAFSSPDDALPLP